MSLTNNMSKIEPKKPAKSLAFCFLKQKLTINVRLDHFQHLRGLDEQFLEDGQD